VEVGGRAAAAGRGGWSAGVDEAREEGMCKGIVRGL